MSKKLFIKCEEAQHFCDKSQYKECSLWDKIRLSIHLLYCNTCRKYSAKNTKLTKLMKDPKVIQLDQSMKDDMKKKLQQKISEK